MPANPPMPGAVRALPLTVTCLLAALLAACGSEPAPPGSTGESPTVPTPDATGEPTQPATSPDVLEAASQDLAPTRALEVTVEGHTELREAALFESPQGYAMYVLPQMTMTPEEPCCDIAWARADDEFTLRIERLDPDQDLAVLRENMALALSAVGEAEELPRDQIWAPQFRDAELAMRAQSEAASRYMLVAQIDGARYRATLHLPHREAMEGIAPTMWAMLDSLRTTGPRPPV